MRARWWFKRRYVGNEFARRVYCVGGVMYTDTEMGDDVLRLEGTSKVEFSVV